MRRALTTLVVAVVTWASWRTADVRLGELFSWRTASSVWRFLSGLFPPDLSAGFLDTVLRAAGQTMAMATAATILSAAIGIPLGVMASATLWRSGILVEGTRRGPAALLLWGLSWTARAALGFIRAVPDLLWAILFVTMVGLGPLAGTLALAVAYCGLAGRIYADAFDSTDPQPLEALQSTGANRLQVFLRGVWPQALPVVTSYTLYSFECSVRAASVLGLVGSGGIGYEIGVSMRLFEYGQVLTLIVALVCLSALTDAASRRLRSHLNRRTAGEVREVREVREGSRRPMGSAIVALTAACASFYFSGFRPEILGETHVLSNALRFVREMLPPELGLDFLRRVAGLLAQTLAIAFLGTIVGVLIGSLLALPAAANVMLLPSDSTGRHGTKERLLRWGGFWAARLALNIMRAIPEIVWVLVCIIAIGIGPFAGAIALAVHTGGVLGKLYAETMEEVPGRPIDALYALGATPLQVVLRGIWPQARPMLRNYTVLRWEANLRVSTILGLVGGGGLGQAIYNDVQLGFYSRVSTMVLTIYGLVIFTDWFTDWLADWLAGSPTDSRIDWSDSATRSPDGPPVAPQMAG